MDSLTALWLGIIQGVTEFLPISSSGHLALFGAWFGLEEPDLTFDILVHTATLAAIIFTFRQEVWATIRSAFLQPNERVPSRIIPYLILASIPAGLVGILGKSYIAGVHAQPIWVGVLLILNGIMLLGGQKLSEGKRHLQEIGIAQVVVMGLAQALAVLPGISRSGSTILAGVASDLHKESAARFSFLMAIPVIAGAELLDARHLLKTGIPEGLILPYTIGFLAALVSGLCALKLLMWLLKGKRFFQFGWYCLGFGGLAIILHLI
ncbi:MAG: undecaprenyl-diphosphate phosphatase [Acidobacteria bacterium]|nr:undecaprenyl-diphosphate phosphatase [Acidobacteriota bacterium]MCB9398951.1 undecaprenyl-diphosphate phosphatase [Acidobacteriota bacterium]